MRVKKRELTLESLVLEIFVWNEEEERGFAAQQSKKECLYVIALIELGLGFLWSVLISSTVQSLLRSYE